MDGRVVCGAGEMGNEGFVTHENREGLIEWVLFSTFSNHFMTNIMIKENIIHASMEIQYIWKIPLASPEKMSCRSENSWGY